ncbi:MAG: DnaJ-class molecular chaperone, partial [Rhodothermales bacterium]
MGFFDSLFGKGASAGHDIVHDVALTVADLSAGAEREISFERLATCPGCKGRSPKDCSCKGSGQAEETHSLKVKLGPELLQQCPDLAVYGKALLGMPELGDAGYKGGATGNLYLQFTIDMGELEADDHEQAFRGVLAAEYDMPTVNPMAEAVSEA